MAKFVFLQSIDSIYIILFPSSLFIFVRATTSPAGWLTCYELWGRYMHVGNFRL